MFSVYTDDTGKGKRRKMSQTLTNNSLHDVTNSIDYHPRNSMIRAKLSFGNQSAVELVKSRQRKIFKDISHFKNAIDEIDKEIINLDNELIPNISNERLTKNIDFLNLNNEILSLENDIKEIKSNFETLLKNDELENNNLQLSYSVKITNFENELDEKKYICKIDNEKKLLEIDNMKPDDDFQNEMIELNKQLVDVTQKLNSLTEENQKNCNDFEKFDVAKEFNDFKESKLNSLRLLKDEQTTLLSKRDSLQKNMEESNQNKNNLHNELNAMNSKIDEYEKLIDSTNLKNIELKKKLKEKATIYKKLQLEQDHVEKNYNNIDGKCQVQCDKLLKEQKLRKKLSFAINEIKNTIPIISYTTQSQNEHIVDFYQHVINLSQHPLIKDVLGLLTHEFEPLYDLYQRKGFQKINLFYISLDKTENENFLTTFVKFLNDKSKYNISIQLSGSVDFKPLEEYDEKELQEEENVIEFKLETKKKSTFAIINFVRIDSEIKLDKLNKATKDNSLYYDLMERNISLFICNHLNHCQEIHKLIQAINNGHVKQSRHPSPGSTTI